MKLFKLLLFSCILCLHAVIANADPPSTAIVAIADVKTRPNLYSVAVSAWIVGDADTNATVRLFYKRAEGTRWERGMIMVRRPGGKGIGGSQYLATNYEGRLINLAPGRNYRYYIEATEINSDGSVNSMVSPQIITQTQLVPKLTGFTPTQFTPFSVIIPDDPDDPSGGGQLGEDNASGPRIYVRQNGGNNNNDGTTWETAVQSIGQAISWMAVRDSITSIVIAPGHYHESVDLNYGYPAQKYFVGLTTTPDSVVICGANALYEKGLVLTNTKFVWTPDGGTVYKTYFPNALCFNFIIGDERLVRKISRVELDAVPLGSNGWYRSGDYLYVKLRSGTSPYGRRLYFGDKPHGINVASNNWRISNITFQYQGYDATPYPNAEAADLNYDGYGIVIGVGGSASNIIIDNCKFIGTGSRLVYANRGNNGAYSCDNVTVYNCYFDGMWKGTYDEGKTRDGEDVSVMLEGKSSIFVGNYLKNMFNGIQPTSMAVTDTTLGSWSEVSYNTFKHITDDAIELDSYQSINRLISYNTIDSCGRGISFAPIKKNGPNIVIYNLITNCEGGLKLGDNSYAPTLIYNNTIVGGKPLFNPGGQVRNLDVRNNIFWGRKTTYVLDIAQNNLDTYSPTKNYFNYNLYDSTTVTAMVRVDNATNGSLRVLRNFNSKFEPNGKIGLSGIQSLQRGDYRLKFPSNAIDTGVEIPGITNSDRGPLFYIKPDMGRFEKR